MYTFKIQWNPLQNGLISYSDKLSRDVDVLLFTKVFIVLSLYRIASKCTGIAIIVYNHCVLLFHCLSAVN